MRIAWEESTCFCIAYSNKSTSRYTMYKSVSRPKRTLIKHTSNHSSATNPRLKLPLLTGALYYKNTAGNMDRPNPDHANAGETNYGLQKRAAFTF